MVLLSCELTADWPEKTGPSGTIVGKSVMELTKHFLIGCKASSTGRIQIWYCKFGQKCVAGEVIGPSTEAAAVVLLTERCAYQITF